MCDNNVINRDEDYPFGKPISEEDMPITDNCLAYDGIVGTTKLKYEDLLKEKDKNRADKKYFKAYNLIYVCIIGLLFLYVFDYIALGVTGRVNDNMGNIAEALKALLFSLSGYLFAERQKH